MSEPLLFDYYHGDDSEQFSFYRIPRLLITDMRFKNLSTDAKLLYGIMLDRMSLSAKNNWYDDTGRVYIYYSLDDIQEALNCGHEKAVKLLAELDTAKGAGLIERRKQGQGKPTKIFVKRFVPITPPPVEEPAQQNSRFPIFRSQEIGKTEVQNSAFPKSGLPKSRSADFRKTESSYTNQNQTEFSYPDPSIHPSQTPIDRIDCEEEVKANIEYATSIKTMLHNPTYLGKIVSGRRTTRSFKDKQIIFRPEEDWIVTENTHEAIIDQRTWDLAHEKLTVRKRCDNHGAIQMFAGLVKCADCGYALAFTQNGGNRRYQCSQYNVKGKNYCSSHHITYDELYDAVLHDIRRRAQAAANMDEHMLHTLRREASGQLDKKLRQAEKEFKLLDSRITELDTVIGRLYEDSALNRISPDRFDTLLQKYEGEQAELKTRHIEVKKELAEQQKRQNESERFMEMIALYKDITQLDSTILNELVQSIELGAIRMVDGVKHRSIRIRYRQYCYVEVLTGDEVFGNWDESMRDAWRQVDEGLAAKEVAV